MTIVGPGGAGKTRLAVEAARADPERWDGVFLVELAAVRDPDLVAGAIVTAMELPESGDPPAVRLRRSCTGRRLLLVLDNCEHLVDAAAAVTEELLSACEEVHVLATSREALRVAGESVWPIPPLAEPHATELFTRRATALDPAFSVDPASLPVIQEICGRLDGLPLAIELAAARTDTFSVAQVAARLDDRFGLLTGGSRTAAARQQTLRAVVEWSYDLLSEDERRLFDRFSVFAGGATIEAVEAICGTDGLARDGIADLVTALVQKSLLGVDRTRRRPRLRMLQTLHQLARERLVERGEVEEVLGRASGYFGEVCAGGRDAFQGHGQRAWHHAMQSDGDNVRTAFDWSVRSGDRERALAIAADVGLHRWVTGTAREGLRWLELAFEVPGTVTPFVEGWALLWRAFLGHLTGRNDVDGQFEAAIGLLRTHGGPIYEAYAMSFHAQVVGETGRRERSAAINEAALAVIEATEETAYVRANRTWLRAGLAIQREGDLAGFEVLLREAVAQFREAGDEFMTAICLDLVSEFEDASGDVDAAIAQRREALEIVVNLRMARFEVALLARLGGAAVLTGDHVAAGALLEVALTRATELAAVPVRALALNALGDLRRREGRLDDAEGAARAARDIYAEAGPRFSSSFSRATSPTDVPAGLAAAASVLGFVASERGQVPDAIGWQLEGCRVARSIDHPRAVPRAVEGLAVALAGAGEARPAAQLLGWSEQHRLERRVRRAPSEQVDVDRAERLVTSALGAGLAAELQAGQAADVDVLLAEVAATFAADRDLAAPAPVAP